MKTQMRKEYNSRDNRPTMGIALPGLFMLLVIAMLGFLSCEHDPVDPIGPDPADTTGNPMDTMVIDTMDEDTLGTPCDSNVVYFTKDVLPLLKSNCAKSGCHDVTSHQEDIILDSYESVMASGIVTPFDLNGSEMFEVITESDPDKVMPEPPNQRLSAEQITLLSKWIQQGARDLTCDENTLTCDTTNVTYSGYVAPILSAYCVGCHSGGAPSGNILLNSHAGVQVIALNGRLLGAISWANGYQQMPKGSAKLSDCKINKIKAWINDGTPDN
jgi:Planctomycete cytochrome C